MRASIRATVSGVLTVLQLQYEVSPSPTDGSERGCEGGEGILFGLFKLYFGLIIGSKIVVIYVTENRLL